MANKLPWFTHDHDAHEDGWIRNLVRKQGHVAGWLWWVLLELHHNHGVGDTLKRDIKDVAQAGLTSASVVTRVLTEMATPFEGQTKVSWTLVGTELRLEIKKFRERQSKLKVKTPPRLHQSSVKTPIEEEGEREVEKENILAEPSAPPTKVVVPKQRPKTELQRLVEAYKVAKDVPIDDKLWDKANFGRASKSAKLLMGHFGGDIDKAAAYIFLRGEELNEKGLDWTLETITRHAFDGMGLPKGENNGQQRGTVDAVGISGPGGHRRLASSREVAGEAMRAIEHAHVQAEGNAQLEANGEDCSDDPTSFA